MSDQDFFAEEARLARSALRNLAKEAQLKIQKHGDIRPLIKKRPWISLLSAFGGGIVTGFLATPARRAPEEEKKRRELKEEKKQERKAQKGSILERNFASAFTPALRTFAATAAGALFHNFQQGDAETNGHAPSHLQHPSAAPDEYADAERRKI